MDSGYVSQDIFSQGTASQANASQNVSSGENFSQNEPPLYLKRGCGRPRAVKRKASNGPNQGNKIRRQ